MHTLRRFSWVVAVFETTLLWVIAQDDVWSKPCARALLLVAHPDDEALFAGEVLLGRAAALPGNCRRVSWHVVSATYGGESTDGGLRHRRTDFRRSLQVARSHGLSTGITEEVWDFEDCNLKHCGLFVDSASGQDIMKLLKDLITPGTWDFVVTHNQQGEYSHVQHMGLHTAVTSTLNNMNPNEMPRLLVFNPIPELNATISLGKVRMIESYYAGPDVRFPRMLLLKSLSQYSEHLVEVSHFTRPSILHLCYFPGAMEPGGLHFQYAWGLASHIDFGELGPYRAESAAPLAEEMLHYVRGLACSARDNKFLPQYPAICSAVQRHFDGGSTEVGDNLRRMEVWSFIPEAVPETVDAGKALTCLQRTSIVGQFATTGGWQILGTAKGPFWMQLLVIRPILVGWKQGYKGRTYKIVGSTAPLKVDLSSGSARVLGMARTQEDHLVTAKPHDIIGWRILGSSAAEGSAAVDDREDVACMSSSECDEAGLCVFKASPPDIDITIQNITAELYEQKLGRTGLKPKFRAYAVRRGLDISEHLEPGTTYEELMTLRNRLDHPDLGLFEDKIRLRKELLPSVGIPSTPSIHISNSDFQVAKHLHGRRSYVVKPSHMSESQNVFVIRDGINLLQQAWGYPDPQADIDQIQAIADTFADTTALDWECKALVSVRPGVIVEELVLATDLQGRYRVDEYKFYVVWGEVVIGENVPFSSGAAMEISRGGDIFTAKVSCPPYCIATCYPQMVQMAEQVARKAQTDYLRVDILVQGQCEAMYVSEVELFPASDFSPELKDIVAQRWRGGYGF